MPARKPHHCTDCGTTDPTLFYPANKSRCRKCVSAKNLARLEANPAAKELNKSRAARWQRDNPVRFRWLQARHRARRKCLDFSITEVDITTLYAAQEGKCAYTGALMTMDCSEHNRNSASVDRVDCSKGYTVDNIVLCCSIVNTMKNNLSMVEFREVIRLLHERLLVDKQ